MAKKKLTSLTDLKATEISLVDRGANKKRRFPVFKQEDPMDPEMIEILKSVMGEEIEDEKTLTEWIEKQKLGDKEGNAVKGAMRILGAFKENPAVKKIMDAMAGMVGYPAPKAEKPEKPDESPPEKKAKKPEEEEEKPVNKSDDAIPEAVQKALDDATERAEKLEKQLVSETRKREMTETVAKCEKEFSLVPGMSIDEMAVTLLDADDDARKRIEKQWAATQEAMAKSDLLRKAGGQGTLADGGDAWAQIEALADQFVEKSDGDLTRATAIDRVLKTERGGELYQLYMAENPVQYGER